MTPLQWTGMGFAAFLIVFLIIAFYTKDRLSEGQGQILRFLCSLCAGFAGGLLTGDALFRLDSEMGSGTKIAISGTAGFALFFTVWFTFRLVASPPPDAFHFSVPKGWTFQLTIDTLAKIDNSLVEFVGFTEDELRAPLRPQELHKKSVVEALLAVRLMAGPDVIRPYDVQSEQSNYRLTVRIPTQPAS